jgi:hypothetical protein
MRASAVKILFISDIIGKPGRLALRGLLPDLVYEFGPDAVIANGENAAGGFGITAEVYAELKALGVDVITSGNHIWDRKDLLEYLDNSADILRPGNYPSHTPGKGSTVFTCASGVKIGVVNLLGRVFMNAVDCPFRVGRGLVDKLRKETKIIVMDMHAETTSEKTATAWYFDGSVSAVIGTHTHVQTSDERILPKGTAFITDAGMTGPMDSVIGMRKEKVLEKFISSMPVRFEVAKGDVELQGVFISINPENGNALEIRRIKKSLKKG